MFFCLIYIYSKHFLVKPQFCINNLVFNWKFYSAWKYKYGIRFTLKTYITWLNTFTRLQLLEIWNVYRWMVLWCKWIAILTCIQLPSPWQRTCVLCTSVSTGRQLQSPDSQIERAMWQTLGCWISSDYNLKKLQYLWMNRPMQLLQSRTTNKEKDFI